MKPLLIAIATLLLLGAAHPAAQEVRFAHADLYLDPGELALHAWQVELVDPSGRARLVGVEGGEDAVWAEPPHYDPAALKGGRVILAAFTLDGGPRGRQRVARVHLAVEGPAPVDFEIELQAAAGERGVLTAVNVELIQ